MIQPQENAFIKARWHADNVDQAYLGFLKQHAKRPERLLPCVCCLRQRHALEWSPISKPADHGTDRYCGDRRQEH